MNLIQFQDNDVMRIGFDAEGNGTIVCFKNPGSLYDFFTHHISMGEDIERSINNELGNKIVSYSDLLFNRQIQIPVAPTDLSHCHVSGVGLTHSSSVLIGSKSNNLTDVERVHLAGLEQGKPNKMQLGARPAWFYKGNGNLLRPTGEILDIPLLAKGVGEEAELVAIYIIDKNRVPRRVGFSLGNEFSDHLLEKENLYYLPQAKMLNCSVGAEIFPGELPNNMKGKIEILNKEEELTWGVDIETGWSKLIHSLENIENYAFQNAIFCMPGDVHYLFLGSDKLSFSDGVVLNDGDQIKIYGNLFSFPLVNKIRKRTP